MKVSLIQMDSREDIEANFSKAMNYLEKSLTDKPDIICLSERFLYWGEDCLKNAENLNYDRIGAFREFAKENKVNIILGSVALKSEKNDKLTNTSFVINRKGEIVFRYDKIYMFNVEKKDIFVRESDSTNPGKELGFFSLEGIKIGLGICYDLRYPEYFQALVKKGAEIIFLPSSFRKRTGKIAWNILTRARAIENQVYFCACNQTGESGVKERCGNSMIISYDGSIVKKIESEEGIICEDLDLESLREHRKEFPVLKQIRKF
ncbi:MAG: nitrilase-related carbon-nitrogen hydrolase [Nanoarchaeota archaeon]|nr:nitrilase-related carbon-nitrogen hydrolase [Nanoarchaeota archaeon]